MTTGATSGAGLRCPQCGSAYRQHDRFCGSCRRELAAGGPLPHTTPVPVPRGPHRVDGVVDAPTRYLCAAAHLDASFGDSSLREYLVEPTRAMPSTPGIDAAAVLREAVAARARRRLRDGALLVLLVLFAWSAPVTTALWVLVGTGIAATTGRFAPRIGPALVAVGAAAVALLVLPSLAYLLPTLLAGVGVPRSTVVDPDGGVLWSLVLGGLIVGVLAVDEAVVTGLARGRFRSGVAVDRHGLQGFEPAVRTLGHARWRAELRRVADAGSRPVGSAEVVVYRTPQPFVGAGRVVDRQSLPVRLVPAEHGDNPPAPRPFAASELLDGVSETVRRLTGSAALSPSRRLAGIEVLPQVHVSADRLVRHRHAPALAGLLPDAEAPPVAWMSRERATALADRPDEVARRHQCFRVESWDRDLTVSCLLTATSDGRTVYLEWTHCVLPPIRRSYRSIDEVDEEGPYRRIVREVLHLPATVPERVRNLSARLGPARRHPDGVDPSLYGAGRSLRELAAEDGLPEHFQRSDADFYVQILQQAVFQGVGEFLASRGYSVADVRAVAHTTVTRNINVNGGDLRGAHFGDEHGTRNQYGKGARP